MADRQGYDVWDKALVVDAGDDGSDDVPDVSTEAGLAEESSTRATL